MRRRQAAVVLWLVATAAPPGPAFAQAAEPGNESKSDDYRDQMASTVETIVNARAAEGQSDLNYSMAFKTGMMQYEQSGITERESGAETEISLATGVNATNGALEWEWFQRRNLATYMGYRLAYNDDVKRTQYQAGYGGVRFFPLNAGIPIDSWRNLTRVRYRPKFAPYVESGLVVGRYLLNVFGTRAALDVSSEFYGASVGAGAMVPLAPKTAAGLGVVYEYDKGYGPILFRAQTLFAQVAVTRYY